MSPLECVTEALGRHGTGALCLSGGKDSTALLYALRPILDRLTVYHMDTGDLLPEVSAIVADLSAWVPNFVRVTSDARAWTRANGLPSDLVPYTQHWLGEWSGQRGAVLVGRYDCCLANLMLPLWERIKADGHTLIIRGSKASDMPRLPVSHGKQANGVEICLPIEGWDNAAVMDYLRSVGAPIAPLYAHMENAPECARCSAWWGERRAAYLRDHYPALYADYQRDMLVVVAEVGPSVEQLFTEMRSLTNATDAAHAADDAGPDAAGADARPIAAATAD